eukprot:3926921-Prymnesium_polylepis.2
MQFGTARPQRTRARRLALPPPPGLPQAQHSTQLDPSCRRQHGSATAGSALSEQHRGEHVRPRQPHD